MGLLRLSPFAGFERRSPPPEGGILAKLYHSPKENDLLVDLGEKMPTRNITNSLHGKR